MVGKNWVHTGFLLLTNVQKGGKSELSTKVLWGYLGYLKNIRVVTGKFFST